jgi:hypothetical protein
VQYLPKQYVYEVTWYIPIVTDRYAVFCTPPEGAICLTCGTHLELGDYGSKPAVFPRKKKKKKRVNGVDTGSAVGTPRPVD